MPNHPIFYSLRSNCWDLSAENENAQIKEFQCYHIKADTTLLYIYLKLKMYGINDAVVIDAEDADVIVLDAYVAHQINGDLGIKKKGNIFDCKSLCLEEVAEIIVPLQIHTGADAVPGFYGHVCGDKDSTTFVEARALKWNKMKKKSTQRVPPDHK